MKNFEVINKKASYNYEFIDTYIAGIVLQGTEIVGIRNGRVDISESYCYFIGNELFMKNASINLKSENNSINKSGTQKSVRDRKLLLNKSELKKIHDQVKIKGLSVVPYKLIINENNLCKVVIVVAKGKKAYDKRQAIKERELNKQIKMGV
jgi:SsrA-binding protein